MGSDPSRPEQGYTSLARRAFPAMNDLFAAGDDVREVMGHPGWSHVMRLIELSEAEVAAMLDGRLLDSRAAYAREHGRLSGYRAMREAAHAIVSEADRKLAEQTRKHEGAAESALRG